MNRPLARLITTLAVAWLAAPLAALAADADRGGGIVYEVRAGVLDHDTDGLWSGFNRESGVDANLEFIFTSHLEALGGTVRPALGGSFNSEGDTSKGYLAARWEIEPTDNLFFALGIGGAVHSGELELVDNEQKALGLRVLFYFPIELGYRFDNRYSISAFFDHVSNAWLADPNEGMDTLGIRLGYRF